MYVSYSLASPGEPWEVHGPNAQGQHKTIVNKFDSKFLVHISRYVDIYILYVIWVYFAI